MAATANAAERRDALVERLFMDAISAFDLLSVYLGDVLGLYRTLADKGALTSAELADAAGIHERYAREWLPGVDADAMAAISCTYTSTGDTDFVLDRVGPVVVGAGFSGHGFKFVPTVGRILADLVEGTARPAALFSAGRG